MCTFDERCDFGEECVVNSHTLKGFKLRTIAGMGRNKRTLMVWDTEDGFFVQSGCFFGTKEEMLALSEEKYGKECTKYLDAFTSLTEGY